VRQIAYIRNPFDPRRDISATLLFTSPPNRPLFRRKRQPTLYSNNVQNSTETSMDPGCTPSGYLALEYAKLETDTRGCSFTHLLVSRGRSFVIFGVHKITVDSPSIERMFSSVSSFHLTSVQSLIEFAPGVVSFSFTHFYFLVTLIFESRFS
jgi:hypothetical protein